MLVGVQPEVYGLPLVGICALLQQFRYISMSTTLEGRYQDCRNEMASASTSLHTCMQTYRNTSKHYIYIRKQEQTLISSTNMLQAAA